MRYEEREKSDFGIWGFDEKKKREETPSSGKHHSSYLSLGKFVVQKEEFGSVLGKF